MIKYNKKTLFDYITGKEIIDYNIEELENDSNFMKSVIDITNDKKMYNLCSEELKNNYEFVKYLINKFSYDKSFIKKISSIFLENSNNKLEKTDILLIISKQTNNDEETIDYLSEAYLFYVLFKVQIEIALAHKDNKEIKKELGMGFVFILEEMHNYKNVIDYFAKNFIKEIFYENKMSLEEILHKNFKNKKDLDNVGINTFLLNYISTYDIYLSNYISTNLKLLNDLKKDISYITKRWDFYLKDLNSRRLSILIYEIDKLMNSNIYDASFNCYNLVYQILKSKNISLYKEFEKYDLSEIEINPKIISLSKERFKIIINSLITDIFKQDVIQEKSSFEKALLKMKCRNSGLNKQNNTK